MCLCGLPCPPPSTMRRPCPESLLQMRGTWNRPNQNWSPTQPPWPTNRTVSLENKFWLVQTTEILRVVFNTTRASNSWLAYWLNQKIVFFFEGCWTLKESMRWKLGNRQELGYSWRIGLKTTRGSKQRLRKTRAPLWAWNRILFYFFDPLVKIEIPGREHAIVYCSKSLGHHSTN